MSGPTASLDFEHDIDRDARRERARDREVRGLFGVPVGADAGRADERATGPMDAAVVDAAADGVAEADVDRQHLRGELGGDAQPLAVEAEDGGHVVEGVGEAAVGGPGSTGDPHRERWAAQPGNPPPWGPSIPHRRRRGPEARGFGRSPRRPRPPAAVPSARASPL